MKVQSFLYPSTLRGLIQGMLDSVRPTKGLIRSLCLKINNNAYKRVCVYVCVDMDYFMNVFNMYLTAVVVYFGNILF